MPQKIVITDKMLRSWIRCRRKAWLDKYGDKHQRKWSAHRTLQLDHQEKSFAYFMNAQGAHTGIKACEEGKSFVRDLTIKCKTDKEQLIEGHPSLLQKINGLSKWGDFSYRPVVTRQGYKITREHRLLLTFTGILISNLQEAPVKEGMIVSQINDIKDIQSINLSKQLEKNLLSYFPRINNDINSKEPPPITNNRRKCSVCSWQNLCNKEAKRQGHLSEVSGIGGKRVEILKEIGINDIKDLAKANIIDLEKKLYTYGEQHSGAAHQLVNQALVQINGKEKNINPSKALPELANAKGVLIYDIESDPDSRHDFLHGFVRLSFKEYSKTSQGKVNYQPILITDKNKEDSTWERLKRKINFSPDWPILHYGETEALAICKIAKNQGLSDTEVKKLKTRFIDIHARLRQHWLLPLNSYSLKAVASLFGFEWNQKGAEGPLALLWWRQWQASNTMNQRKFQHLERIFTYNKDDCLATWKITEWLLKK